MPRSILSRTELRKIVRLEPSIQRNYGRKLASVGFEKPEREALLRITPHAAAGMLDAPKSTSSFATEVEAAGRELALLNVSAERVHSALTEYEGIDDRFRFEVIIMLNQAYQHVRERECQALHQLLRATYETVNLDVVLRTLLETIAQVFGASGGHLFLWSDGERRWELRASTPVAATAETTVSVRGTPAQVRKLSNPVSGGRVALDRGWARQWSGVWSIPMIRSGKVAGVMQFGFKEERSLLPREIELLTVAAERCVAAAERAKLLDDIAEREARMRELARKMLQVEEIERRRLSRELHDDAGQSLVVIRLQMEMIELSMPSEAGDLRDRLSEARDLTEKTIISIRKLISDLSPAVLEQLGLGAAIRQLVKRFNQVFAGAVCLEIGEIPTLDSDFEIVVYRLAQECLHNVAKHSFARNVNISLSSADRILRLVVADDGVGFHVGQGLGQKRCFGLLGMRERVTLLGGKFELSSTPKKAQTRVSQRIHGTRVNISLPIEK